MKRGNGAVEEENMACTRFHGMGGGQAENTGTRQAAGVGIDEPRPGSVGIHLDDWKR